VPRVANHRETDTDDKRPAGEGAAGDAAAAGTPPRRGVRLGVDVGSVRIGIARSDPGGFLASPLATVRRGRGDLDRIAALAAENQAVEVIVGLPASLSGREGRPAADARRFAAALAGRLSAPDPDPADGAGGAGGGAAGVRLFDERFSTVAAHGALRAGGRDERARRPVVDKAAAAVLLQAALDAERSTGRPPGEAVAPPAAPESL
jgi:putative holliday junction resolvase